MSRYWALLPLAVVLGAFVVLLIARLGPASLLLVEPLVGFGLGYLVASYLNRRVLLENRQLRAELESLAAQNRELREAVDRFLEQSDA